MKVITLTQPWATLVAIGAKKIETRSWSTPYRGPLAIHAAKGFPTSARDLMWTEPFFSALGEWGRTHNFSLGLPLGKIIAVCELKEVLPIVAFQDGVRFQRETDYWKASYLNLPEEPELSFGNYAAGRFAWILENVHVLKEPIPARGALGLWTFSGDIPEKETA